MRIGLIARCDDTGLGNQTFGFYKHMQPSKVMVIDFADYNPLPQHVERYPDAWRVVRGFPKADDIDAFLDDVDLVFTCEIPYNYYLFEAAKKRGVKTVLQYNWEFLDYLQDPSKPLPDLFGAPSTWHFNELPYENKRILRVPVDIAAFADRMQELLHTPKTKGFRIMVPIGRPAVHDRNGALSVVNALRLVTKDVHVIFYSQDKAYLDTILQACSQAKMPRNVTVEMRGAMADYRDAYLDADICVIPRRFGGLCLPMQEALAAGLPTVMTDISPNEDLLPKEWRVPAQLLTSFKARTTINVYEADEEALAAKLDWFAGMSEKQYLEQTEAALGRSVLIGWPRQKKWYTEAFEQLCQQK